MLVSVVIPTKDRPELLAKAINGVNIQSHSNIELIVVDDGSSSENAEKNQSLLTNLNVISTYVYVEGKLSWSKGPASSRNIGIKNATGELIAFCDDDDYWCNSDFIKTMADVFSNDPNVDMSFANQHAFRSGELAYDIWLPHLIKLIGPKLATSDAMIEVSKAESLCWPGDFGCMNTCLFRKELLVRIDSFRLFKYAEDLDLFVRAADCANKIIYWHSIVCTHIIGDRAKSDNITTSLDDIQKKITLVQIAIHLLSSCKSIEAKAYATGIASFASRDLAVLYNKDGRFREAFFWAKVSWSLRPTIKWSAYLTLMGVKALISPSK